MATFTDSVGNSWTIELDGLLLGVLRERTGIDLSQDGLFLVENSEEALTNVLLVLCREQIDNRKMAEQQFAKLIFGDIADKAIEAVGGAAKTFFRPKRWSAIQSRCAARAENEELYQSLLPMLAMLDRPEMPAQMRDAVMDAIGKQIEAAATSSRNSAENPSASGPDATPPNAVSDLLDSLESTRAA